jgi:formylglycine-generating enzyme required for sulfatase activity
LIVVFTIRSDMYERLQLAKELESLRQETLSLPPMPKGSYAEVIKGPPLRLKDTKRGVEVEEGLVNALLVDIDEAGGKDALPLLAFTLERLYVELGTGDSLKLEDYEKLGRIKGSIEAAVEGAFKRADKIAGIPKERAERLALLRRGLIPSLATIDPETGEPLRRVARRSEIPAEAVALIDLFVDQRLLATDVGAGTGDPTIEPAHEALLRQWGLLRSWLAEDTGQLRVLQAVKRAAQEWANNDKAKGWLTHGGERLDSAEKLFERPDLAANLAGTDRDYLTACRKAAATARNRKRALQAVIYTLLVGVICGLVGWINQRAIVETYTWHAVARPYMNTNFRPHVLTAAQEHALKPGDKFAECGEACPAMMVVPAGEYMMGSPQGEIGRADDEGPRHAVKIAKPFAISIYELRVQDWDACVKVGGCVPLAHGNWEGGNQPAINVSWTQAEQYVAWLSLMTGKTYRLLSEAEWEYAARATTSLSAPAHIYYWGNELGHNNANCPGCGSEWDKKQPAPVGSFAPNAFGLHDMLGNVWEWVEDCYFQSYAGGAPADAAPRTDRECATHVVRGGSWVGVEGPASLPRSAKRDWRPSDGRTYGLGLRVARTLDQ